jgi:hypothetical protein
VTIFDRGWNSLHTDEHGLTVRHGARVRRFAWAEVSRLADGSVYNQGDNDWVLLIVLNSGRKVRVHGARSSSTPLVVNHVAARSGIPAGGGPARRPVDNAALTPARPVMPSRSELRITRVFPGVAHRFKARVTFMFAGCCGWRSLAADSSSGASRGHTLMRRRGPVRCSPWAPPFSPIGLTAAALFAGGEVSRVDSRVR